MAWPHDMSCRIHSCLPSHDFREGNCLSHTKSGKEQEISYRTWRVVHNLSPFWLLPSGVCWILKSCNCLILWPILFKLALVSVLALFKNKYPDINSKNSWNSQNILKFYKRFQSSISIVCMMLLIPEFFFILEIFYILQNPKNSWKFLNCREKWKHCLVYISILKKLLIITVA